MSAHDAKPIQELAQPTKKIDMLSDTTSKFS